MSIDKVSALENREFLPPPPVRLQYVRPTPRRTYAASRPLPPVLKREDWRLAVLKATKSDVQACKLYSLFTTYNVQTPFIVCELV